MIFDSESVYDTAEELNLTSAEVERALKIHAAYARHSKRLSNRRKLERQRFLKKKMLAAEKLHNPERCFCIEDGISVERDANSDEVIRCETRKFFTIVGIWTGTYENYPIYRCKNCGKEWEMRYAIA